MTANAPRRLAQLRAASLAMLDGLTPAEQRAQSHAELSPMLWHVGHVFFVETYWLAERIFGDTSVTDAWCDLYFPEICPKKTRASRLPDADSLRRWAHDLSLRNDRYWQQAQGVSHPLLADGYLAAFLRQHYAQHLETMRLARMQLRYAALQPQAQNSGSRAPDPPRVNIDRHRVTIGSTGIDAYDNEKPCFKTEIPAFSIAAHCVTNAEWLGFIEAGGYAARDLWDDDGWAWRRENAVQHPEHWRDLGAGDWHIPSDDEEVAPAEQPVHGVGWYEARAFARYAGARLPREIEWEAAARAGALADMHRVWEWCHDAFYPYPGFKAFPYDGYSRPWFDGGHFVARGASRHTEADIKRAGFRNFYPPGHRHVVAGLRLAW